MNVDTYIINVEHHKIRRENILKKIKEFPCLSPKVIKAIVGSDLSQSEMDKVYLSPKTIFQKILRYSLSKNEIACALSHVKCSHEILNNNLKYALVLEDDVLFSDNFNTSILEAISFIEKSKKPTIVLFSARTTISKKTTTIANGFSFHKCIDGIGAYGYLINDLAAKIIVDKFIPFSNPFDHWFYHVRNGIKVFSIQPHSLSFVGNDDDSALREERNANWEVWHNWKNNLPLFFRILAKFTFKLIYIKIWKLFNRGEFIKKIW